MSSATLVPVSEYLATTYWPDRDFLNGVLQERNLGEQPHALIQGILSAIFSTNRHDWQVRVLPEQRVQVAADRYRIPDLCILRSAGPRDSVIRFAPLLCIEILSSADSLSELQERVNDYASLGVAHIWAIDPWKRRGWHASASGFLQPEDGILRVTGSPIAITLAELFAEMDEN